MNGKVHTFQKDFDDYDSYREFLDHNPEYLSRAYLGNWWNPWAQWDPLLPDFQESTTIPVDSRYLPEGVDLDKYEKKRLEKRQAESEKTTKKISLEKSKSYLEDYLTENADDRDAKNDLEKIEKEIKSLT